MSASTEPESNEPPKECEKKPPPDERILAALRYVEKPGNAKEPWQLKLPRPSRCPVEETNLFKRETVIVAIAEQLEVPDNE